jgi:hypothetical protein
MPKGKGFVPMNKTIKNKETTTVKKTKYMFGITVDMTESQRSTVIFQKLHFVVYVKPW